MSIRRVVPNIKSKLLDESRAFYVDLLGFKVGMDMGFKVGMDMGFKVGMDMGFKVGMDMGFIVTLVSPDNPTAQISLLRDGEGSTTPYAHLSIEVANVDEIHKRVIERGLKIVYPLTDEPWGVRRFCVADPNGTVLNVMSRLNANQK
jgi:catechol 2,3-dioxygenase-like lactoylglutathione lyase family enzyme